MIMYSFILTFLITIISATAGLRLTVTQERCGQSIDLSVWKRMDLDYVESNVFSKPGKCIIDVTTSNDTDIICIRTDRKIVVDQVCSWILSYHIGGYYEKSSKEYTCNDFNYYQKPICDSDSLASIVYFSSYMLTNTTVNVVLFTKEHTQTPVERPNTALSRSPRSVESEYAERLKKKQKVGVIVGLSFLGFFGALFCIICCYLDPCDVNETQANTPAQVQPPPEQNNVPEPEQSNGLVTIPDNVDRTNTDTPQPSTSYQHNDYSGGPPTYDQYIMNEYDYHQVPNQDVDGNTVAFIDENTVAFIEDNTVELPPPEYKTRPSAPPPPYPGY